MHTTDTTAPAPAALTLTGYTLDTVEVQSTHEWTHRGAQQTYVLDHASSSCEQLAGDDLVAVSTGARALSWPCPSCYPDTEHPAPIARVVSERTLPSGGGASTTRTSSTPDTPSEKQHRFMVKLLCERTGCTPEVAEQTAAAVPTKRAASVLIENLLAAPIAPTTDTTTPTAAPAANVRSNRYAAPCATCSVQVAEGAGALTNEGGRWVTRHLDGACPTPTAAAAPTSSPAGVSEDGMYRSPDGTIWKVQVAHHGTGNLYAKRLVVEDGHGEFVYAAGAVRTLHPEWKLTLDEAKSFGKLYGVCCCCARVLTDEHSIAEGIGPVCARKLDR